MIILYASDAPNVEPASRSRTSSYRAVGVARIVARSSTGVVGVSDGGRTRMIRQFSPCRQMMMLPLGR